MPDDRPTISSSRLAAADVARHSFGTVRRGYDPAEVRTFLEAVARELTAGEQREVDLRHEVSAAEERALHPVIDEATLTSSLGQQSALVLRNAHQQADAIVHEAEERAAGLRHEAQSQVQAAESSAAQRIAEAELAIGGLHQEIEAASAARTAADAVSHQELLQLAREEGRALVEEAQQARKRVLADLAQRRRGLHLQIEQFRAARDELAAAVLNVRDEVDRVVADLAKADDNARAAAAEVRMRQPVGVDPADLELAEVVDEVVDEVEVAAGTEAPPALVVVEAGSAVPPQRAPTPPEDPPSAEAVPPATEPSPEGDPGADPADVEALFARLRAGAPDGAEVTDGRPPPPVDAPTAAGGAEAEAAESDGAEADDDEDQMVDGPSGLSGEEAEIVARRALRLDPAAAQLGKRLKRALQDDQNQLLNRIRAANGRWSDEMVPSDEEHQLRYATVAGPPLSEAWTAGLEFARSELSGSGAKGRADTGAVNALAAELASSVVTALRRRLSGTEGHEGEDASDRVGAAYREWRGERIEGLVGDFAVAAFSGGTRQGAGPSAGTRWVLARHDGACADCDDNSLAGAVGPGEEFPTGHHHPPAHGGCRCVVVPTQG